MTHRQDDRIGVIAYNGFRFPAPSNSNIISKPIYDDAGRNVKYVEITINVSCTITAEDQLSNSETVGVAGEQVDLNFENLRQRLQQSGKNLLFTDQGFGNLEVNDIGTIQDVDFGPKPNLVSWKSIGSNRTIFLVWECTTRIPECGGGNSSTFLQRLPTSVNRVTQFNYSVNWSITNGLTVRTINGILEITLNRKGNNRIPDTADNYRDRINFPVPLRFKRNQNWDLSIDKKTLSFNIVDSEIPTDSVLQPGIVTRDITHRVASNIGQGYKKWSNTLSGSIEVAPGYSKSFAWNAFLDVLKQITDQSKKGTFTDSSDDKLKKDKKQKTSNILLFTNIEIIDNIDGRDISFSISYLLLCNLRTILQATGLFQQIKVPNQSWQSWRISMRDAFGPRGVAQMKHLPSDDIIVNVCDQNSTESLAYEQSNDPRKIKNDDIFDCDRPDPDKSWLSFNIEFELQEFPNTVVHRPMQQVPNTSATSSPSSLQIAKDAGLVEPSITLPKATRTETVEITGKSWITPKVATYQVRGPTLYIVVMRGTAVRVGYKIAKPTMTHVGGIPVIKRETAFVHKEIKSLGTNCKTYAAQWVTFYFLESPPSNDVMNLLNTHHLPGNFNQ